MYLALAMPGSKKSKKQQFKPCYRRGKKGKKRRK